MQYFMQQKIIFEDVFAEGVKTKKYSSIIKKVYPINMNR